MALGSHSLYYLQTCIHDDHEFKWQLHLTEISTNNSSIKYISNIIINIEF